MFKALNMVQTWWSNSSNRVMTILARKGKKATGVSMLPRHLGAFSDLPREGMKQTRWNLDRPWASGAAMMSSSESSILACYFPEAQPIVTYFRNDTISRRDLNQACLSEKVAEEFKPDFFHTTCDSSWSIYKYHAPVQAWLVLWNQWCPSHVQVMSQENRFEKGPEEHRSIERLANIFLHVRRNTKCILLLTTTILQALSNLCSQKIVTERQ